MDPFWAGLMQEYVDAYDHNLDVAHAVQDGPPPPVRPPALHHGPRPQVSQAVLHKLTGGRPETWSEALLAPLCDDIAEFLGLHVGHPLVDAAVQKLGSFYLERPRALHATKAVLGTLLNLDPKKIEPGLCSLASALIHTDRQFRHQLEAAAAGSDQQLMLYLDINRFDETPMKVSVRQNLDNLLFNPLQDVVGPQPPQADPLSHPDVRGRHQARASTTAKLFASEQRYAMVIRRAWRQDFEGDSPYLFLQGQALTNLQVLERATGAVMKEALLLNNGVSRSANDFVYKVRVTTTDMAPANALAEASIMRERDANWSHLHLPCNVHIISRIFTRTFSFAEDQVSGMINFALSLSQGPAMEQFRKTMATIIEERLVIIPGVCPVESGEYRRFILDLFCTTGSHVALKQHLLGSLPNGDWRNSERVEVYIEPGVAFEEAVVRNQVTTALLLSLSHKAFSTYPRHRWLGCDLATDEYGLCEAVHGLASATYERMLEEGRGGGAGHGRAGQVPPRRHSQQGRGRGSRTRGQQPNLGSPAAVPGDVADIDHPATGTSGEPHPARPGEERLPEVMAAENERRKRQALTWLSSRPLGRIMAMRLCMKPLTELMISYMQRSSQVWEKQQRGKACAPAAEGEAPAYRSGLMDYVRLVSEQQFFRGLTQMLDDTTWQCLPPSCWTHSFQTFVFKMSSRMGACIEELLVEPTRRFPLRLFQLLANPQDVGQELLSLPKCVLDDFSQKHLQHFEGARLVSEDSLACLHAIQRVASTETVGIEWGHGRVHRLTTKSSVQSQPPSLEYVSAQWLCQKVVQRASQTWAGLEASGATPRPAVPGQADGQEQPARKTRGGGGAWRGFVSMKEKGTTGRTDFQSLGEQYRKAQQDNTPEYQEAVRLGAAARERHRLSGVPSFGPRPREVTRHSVTRWLQTHAQAGRVPHSLTSCAALQDNDPMSLTLINDLQLRITQVRKAQVAARRSSRVQREEEAARLVAYCKLQQGAALEGLLESIPAMLTGASSFFFVPDQRLLYFEVVPDNNAKAIDIAAWSAANSRTSNSDSALQADWCRRHSTIFANSSGTDAQERKQTPCCRYGLCLCQGTGRDVMALRNHFLQIMKAQFDTRLPDQKERLQDGGVVVELQQVGESIFTPEWQALIDSYIEEDATKEGPTWSKEKRLFLHLALQYFKPYRPTFHLLKLVETQPGPLFTLEQTGVFLPEFRLWCEVDVDTSWSVTFHEVLVRSAPVVLLQPKQCLCSPIEGLHTEVLWPLPPPAKRAFQGRRRGRRTDAAVNQSQAGVACTAPPGPGLEDGCEVATVMERQLAAEDEAFAESEDDESEELGEEDDLFDLLNEHLQNVQADIVLSEEVAATQEAGIEEPFPSEELAVYPPAEELLESAEPPSAVAAEPLETADEAVTAAVESEADPGEASMAARPPPPVVAFARGARSKAEFVAEVPGGRLSWYFQGMYTAQCNNEAHGKCVLTRTSQPGRRAAQGRPLGLLSSWLALGQDLPTKASH